MVHRKIIFNQLNLVNILRKKKHLEFYNHKNQSGIRQLYLKLS